LQDTEANNDNLSQYRMLTKKLLQRYFRKTMKEASEDKPTKQHVAHAKDNIKQLTKRVKYFKGD